MAEVLLDRKIEKSVMFCVDKQKGGAQENKKDRKIIVSSEQKQVPSAASKPGHSVWEARFSQMSGVGKLLYIA